MNISCWVNCLFIKRQLCLPLHVTRTYKSLNILKAFCITNSTGNMLLLGNNCNRFFWKLIVGEVFGILAKRNLSTNAILSPTGRSILSTTSDFGMVLSLVLIDIYVPFVSSPFLLFSLPFFCFIFFPQNHRMVEVGRELWRSSGPTLAAQVGTPRTSCPCSF